jgi:hypothetical protein
MKKRTLIGLLFGALAISAFARQPAARPAPEVQMTFQFLTTVHDDGSVDFGIVLKFSPTGLEELLKGVDYTEDEVCAKATSEIENVLGTFSQEKHGEEIWCTYSTTLDNLQGLRNQFERDYSVDVNRLEIEDSAFFLDMVWHQFPCTSLDSSKYKCEWVVEAPGKVGKNNATSVSGNTLTWDMTSSSTPKHFTAESEVGGFDPTLLIIGIVLLCGCCLVIFLIGGGVGLYLYMRKRNQTPAGTQPAAPSAPPASSPAETIRL